MDFQKLFHSIIKNNFILKIAPNFFFWLIDSTIHLPCVTSMYNYGFKHSSKNAIQREESQKYFSENADKISENLLWLSDERSRLVYSNVIKYRCTGENRCIKSVADSYKNQYIDEVVIDKWDEVFVDAGALFGESTKALIKAKGCCDKVSSLIIEPDEYNFGMCRKNLSKYDNMFFEKCGAGSNEKTVSFKGGLFGSCRADELGADKIPINTIDILCEKYHLCPTYIKMDIEGMESEALIGAMKTIEQFRPKLAISIYHSDEDMIEIIRFIKSHYCFYDFYIRHYSGFFADTVLYCIPKSR